MASSDDIMDTISRELDHKKQLKIVKDALENGFNINKQDEHGYTLLQIFISRKSFQVSLFLLNYGADPNIQNCMGETALHIAVKNNMFQAIKMLVSFDTNLNIQNCIGETPLFFANKKIAEFLLKNGADTTIKNNNGASWTNNKRFKI